MGYKRFWAGIGLVAFLIVGNSVGAWAASCGGTGAGFEDWKQSFSGEARAHGVGEAGISALMNTHYSTATIGADRGQKSFKLSLDQFMKKRGATTIVARGRQLKKSQAALFASLERDQIRRGTLQV